MTTTTLKKAIAVMRHLSPRKNMQVRFAGNCFPALFFFAILAFCTAGDAQSSLSAKSVTGKIQSVVVLDDSGDSATAEHGISTLEQALRARGIRVSEKADDVDRADTVILAGLAASNGPAVTALGAGASLPAGPEALAVKVGATYRSKPAIVLCGSDGTGLMYAALDLAQRVSWTSQGDSPFAFAHSTEEKPFLRDRGVVIFTMNRAYFESRFHDPHYWER